MPKAFSESLADLNLIFFFYVLDFCKRIQQAEPPLFPFVNILMIHVWNQCCDVIAPF